MSKYPILILHGWNLEGNRFYPLVNEFIKRGYQVMCPDLPGFGSTAINKSFNLDDYVKYVTLYLKKKKVNKIFLIGHSFGGRIGIKLAASHPEFLYGMILTGVPGFTPVSRIKVLFFIILAKIGKLIFSFPVIKSFKNNFQKILYRLAKATDYYNTKENMRETFQNIVKEKLDGYMMQINVPTHLVWGREDLTVPLSIASKMSSVIKNSQLSIIDRGKHLVPITHVTEFADITEKFMNNL